MTNLHLIDHPLIQHKLTLMRRAETSTAKFRALLKEISLLMAYEVTRDLPLKLETIETPMATMQAPVLAPEKKLVVVSTSFWA
jgi:uracil phosphoribosyltransferase